MATRLFSSFDVIRRFRGKSLSKSLHLPSRGDFGRFTDMMPSPQSPLNNAATAHSGANAEDEQDLGCLSAHGLTRPSFIGLALASIVALACLLPAEAGEGASKS